VRLQLFLAQYWGGPTTYSDERGHPRLRMRHAPFVVDAAARDRWLAAMRAALDELDPPPAIRERFDAYFDMSADAMRNAG
jgi:hemoglobin